MYIALLGLFFAVVAANAIVGAAVIYHLRKYTLPGWTAAKIVVPAYVLLSLIFALLALHALSRIPMNEGNAFSVLL